MIDLGKTLRMVDDMEVIEKFIGRKGRFVGDTVSISIKHLADVIRASKNLAKKGQSHD